MAATPRKRTAKKATTATPGAFTLRYIPGTDLAARYPDPVTARWSTFEGADVIRRAMPNTEHIEVIEFVDGTPRPAHPTRSS